MNKFRKRIFGAGILFLMMILAIGTMVSFAEERSSSYHLTIKKVFSDETKNDPVASAEAQKMTYNFRVEGQVKKGGANEYESVVKTVKLPDADGNWEVDIPFDNAFKISVIEQTDDSEEGEYDVIETACESSMHVGASQATVNISRDGGVIKITRPEGVPTVTFRITGNPLHTDKPFNFQAKEIIVAAGKTEELTGLPQGQYTITKLRSADGFSVLVGPRTLTVGEGETGTVHINSSDSKLLITAPAQVGSVPRTHYYHISGPDSRDIILQSGETGTVEHLSEGTYSIKVSETYSGIKGYAVEFPETKSERKSGKYTVISTTTAGTRGWVAVGGDYIDNLTYGPLYNKSGGIMSSTVKYKFRFGAINPDDTSKIQMWTMNAYAKGNEKDKPVSLAGKDSVKKPYEKKLYIGTKEVSDSAAYAVGVSWIEYTVKETELSVTNPSTKGEKVTIDDRGWIMLSKADDPNDPQKMVTYYYTITDSNGENITGFTVTDEKGNPIDVPTNEDGTTVTLKAGQRVKINGLHDGNFYIKETNKPVDPMEFDVTLEETKKSVTTPGGTIDIEIFDTRSVNISRPGDEKDDGSRLYTYNIYRVGDEKPVTTIQLKSGESTTVQEQAGFMLPPGKYHIKAMDDEIVGFDVAFSESSSLVSDYINNATVTFTNHIGEVKASYHVIHEYYLKNDDDSYTLEGVSPVYTKNCDGNHDEKPGHYSTEIDQQEVHNGKTYTHIAVGGDAYGKVVSWKAESAEKKIDDFIKDDIKVADNYKFVRSGRGDSGKDENDKNSRAEYEYAYAPLANLQFATAHSHQEAHDKAAEIIILRYERKKTSEELGKYNIIHVYYRRTSEGDKWEGARDLETVNVGLLTNENRYITYNADSVEKVLQFTPKDENVEYPYVYDGAAYGRIVDSENGDDYNGEGVVGEGKEYRKDDTMTSVKATGEGDQIIILRYYRGGAYNVVHEYYYREAANSGEDPGESGEDTGETTEGGTDLPSGDTTRTGENSVSANDPTGNVETDSGEGLIPEDDANGTEDSSGEIQVLAAGMETNASESDVSGNELSGSDSGGGKDAIQGGENDVSGNNPLGADGDDTSAGDIGIVSENVLDEEMEFAVYNDGIQTLEGENGGFNGTLMDSDGYTYEFEGKSAIVPYSDKLESWHYAENVAKEKIFKPTGDEQYTYVYKDAVYGYLDEATKIYEVAPYKTGAEATARKDEVIILRYIRGDDVREPEEPEPPGPTDPPGGGGGGGGHDPDPTPPPVEEEIPEIPPEELPTELPDPNDPDSPDRITILEDGVPRTYVKVWDPDKLEWVYIPEEEVPLWGMVPQTGDGNSPGFLLVLAAVSLCGLGALKFTPQKKKDF